MRKDHKTSDFAPGQPVWAHHNNRTYEATVVRIEEREGVRVERPNGEQIVVHPYNLDPRGVSLGPDPRDES